MHTNRIGLVFGGTKPNSAVNTQHVPHLAQSSDLRTRVCTCASLAYFISILLYYLHVARHILPSMQVCVALNTLFSMHVCVLCSTSYFVFHARICVSTYPFCIRKKERTCFESCVLVFDKMSVSVRIVDIAL